MPNWKKIITSGSNASLNHITASGNISASGTITAEQLTTSDDLSVGDNLDFTSVNAKILDNGDVNRIQFLNGVTHINAEAANMDFQVETEGQTTLHIDGEADAVVIGATTVPSGMEFTVNGDISGSGKLYAGKTNAQVVIGDGHITASGNISGSSTSTLSIGGNVSAGSFTGNSFQVKNTTSDVLLNPGGLPFMSYEDDGIKTTRIGSDDMGGTNLSRIELMTNAGETMYVSHSSVQIGNGANEPSAIPAALHVKGDISASVSMSAAALSGDGSGITNVTATLPSGVYSSSLQTLGNITASGNISSSGTLDVTGNVNFDGDLDVDGTTNLDAMDIDGNVQLDGTFTVGVNDTGYDATFFGATNLRFMKWIPANDLLKFQDNTKIAFGNAQFADANRDAEMYFNGTDFYISTYAGGSSGGSEILLNNVHSGKGVVVSGSGTTYLNVEGRVGITDNFEATGSIQTDSHITASGNISASGTVSANAASGFFWGTDSTTAIYSDGANSVTVKTNDEDTFQISTYGVNVPFGNVTASGDISASGVSHTFGGQTTVNQITASTLNLEGTGTAELEVDGHITASGNISASGNITALDLNLLGGDIDLKNAGAQSNIKFYCESSNAHHVKLQAPAHSDFSGDVTVTLPATADTLVGKTTTDTLTNKTLTSPDINGGTIDNTVIGGTTKAAGSFTTLTSTGNTTIGNGGDVIQFNPSIFVEGNVTASGDLHIQGNITASAGNFSSHITASGNISSSGNLIANELILDGGTFTSSSLAAGGSGGGGGISFDGSTANGVLTFKDSDEATVESNLTFDGTDLTIDGGLTLKGTGSLQYNHFDTGSAPNGQSYASTGHASGDIVKFGSVNTSTMAAGKMYFLNGSGQWVLADATDNTTGADELLAIALGTDPATDGMLLRGLVRVNSNLGTVGRAVYMTTTAGAVSQTAPSGNDEIVRIVGYAIHAVREIMYFNPSSVWVKVTA